MNRKMAGTWQATLPHGSYSGQASLNVLSLINLWVHSFPTPGHAFLPRSFNWVNSWQILSLGDVCKIFKKALVGLPAPCFWRLWRRFPEEPNFQSRFAPRCTQFKWHKEVSFPFRQNQLANACGLVLPLTPVLKKILLFSLCLVELSFGLSALLQ